MAVSSPTGEPRRTNSGSIARRVVWVVAAAVCMLIALAFPFPVDGRIWNELFDLAHAPAFCGLLLTVAGFIDPSSVGLSSQALRIRCIRSGELMVISGACLMLGFVGEFLQAFVGRSPSAKDLVANASGIVSGVLWMLSRCTRRMQRWLLTAAAVLVLGGAIVRPILGIQAAIQQISEFPLLASFERDDELQIWETVNSEINRTSEQASDGQSCMQVEISPGEFSGVVMTWPVPDWRGYEWLTCDVQSAGTEPLMLTLKLYDKLHSDNGFDPADRFETTVDVHPGKFHTLRIRLADIVDAPAARSMNLGQMAGIELFVPGPVNSGILWVDNIRLAGKSWRQGIPIDSVR